MGTNQRSQVVMSPEEIHTFIERSRMSTLATVGPDGTPHLVAMWYGYLDGALYFETKAKSQKAVNLRRNPSAVVLIEAGDTYDQLRGVLIEGSVERADDDPRLDTVMHRWSEKYMGGNPLPYARWRNRAWFRLIPARFTSWDFRKIPEARAKGAQGG